MKKNREEIFKKDFVMSSSLFTNKNSEYKSQMPMNVCIEG